MESSGRQVGTVRVRVFGRQTSAKVLGIPHLGKEEFQVLMDVAL